METISIPVFSEILGYLSLFDMENLARVSHTLCETVLQDSHYFSRVDQFLICLHKQWNYLQRRSGILDPIDPEKKTHKTNYIMLDPAMAVRIGIKYRILKEYYDHLRTGFTSLSTMTKRRVMLVPLFPSSSKRE